MLSHLKINNIAIIKEAVIDFDGGLNVLTGETGAGKSIIIDAINAILGERTSRSLSGPTVILRRLLLSFRIFRSP